MKSKADFQGCVQGGSPYPVYTGTCLCVALKDSSTLPGLGAERHKSAPCCLQKPGMGTLQSAWQLAPSWYFSGTCRILDAKMTCLTSIQQRPRPLPSTLLKLKPTLSLTAVKKSLVFKWDFYSDSQNCGGSSVDCCIQFDFGIRLLVCYTRI